MPFTLVFHPYTFNSCSLHEGNEGRRSKSGVDFTVIRTRGQTDGRTKLHVEVASMVSLRHFHLHLAGLVSNLNWAGVVTGSVLLYTTNIPERLLED